MLSLFACLLAAVPCASGAVFTIEDDTYGSGDDLIRLKVLKNTETGESASVLSGWGGKVEALNLVGKDGVRPVIYNHGRNASLIRADDSPGALLTPYTNRVKNGTYMWNGETYYLERTMAGNAIHGFLIQGREMEVASQDATDDRATLRLSYTFNKNGPVEIGYPWKVRVEVSYELSRLGLDVTARALNLEKDVSAPFMFGIHPYFKVADFNSTFVTLDQCSKWNDISVTPVPDLIPTGKTTPTGPPFDGSKPVAVTTFDQGFKSLAATADCPVLEASIQDGRDGDTMYLWMDSSFRYMQVYSGSPEKGVAVEPQAGETDCWNNKQDTIALQAGQSWQGRFGLRMKSIKA